METKTKIKPTGEIKKLLPLDVTPDRQLTTHYRMRPDGSLVYTNGHYSAFTPPNPATATGKEEVFCIDGIIAQGVRLPSDVQHADGTINVVGFERKLKEAERYLAKWEDTRNSKKPTLPGKEDEAEEIELHVVEKIQQYSDEIGYYTKKIENPVDAEMVLDIKLLDLLVKWFASRKGKYGSHWVRIKISSDQDTAQLHMEEVVCKNKEFKPNGYRALLCGARYTPKAR